jgi:hypothetical protein
MNAITLESALRIHLRRRDVSGQGRGEIRALIGATIAAIRNARRANRPA